MKRFLPVPPILILVLLALTANAANLALDGGVVQEFEVDPRLGVPVANAGGHQTVTVGAEVILDGTGSTDSDGETLVYSWALTTPNASSATLDDASSATPAFVADVAGTYIAELTVGDGVLFSMPDTVVITAILTESVTPIPAPDTPITIPDTPTTFPETTSSTTIPETTTTVPETTSSTTVPETTTTVPETTSSTTIPETTTTVPETTSSTTIPETTTTVPDTTTTIPVPP